MTLFIYKMHWNRNVESSENCRFTTRHITTCSSLKYYMRRIHNYNINHLHQYTLRCVRACSINTCVCTHWGAKTTLFYTHCATCSSSSMWLTETLRIQTPHRTQHREVEWRWCGRCVGVSVCQRTLCRRTQCQQPGLHTLTLCCRRRRDWQGGQWTSYWGLTLYLPPSQTRLQDLSLFPNQLSPASLWATATSTLSPRHCTS